MSLPTDLLDLDAARGARLIVLSLIDDAVEARVRFDAGVEPDALHDFRVALRRLRSALSAYRPQLRGAVGRGARRRLRRLARASGESRDLEVHLAWLDAERPTLARRERVGLDALARRLRGRRAAADDALRGEIADHFARTMHRLRERLLVYRKRIHLDAGDLEPPLALAAAHAGRTMTDALERRLAAVHGIADEREAHVARIAAKRLRYLLEPLRASAPAAIPLVERLKELQDRLGELHDAHVFGAELASVIVEETRAHARAESDALLAGGADPAAARTARRRDPRPGLAALAARLRERGDAAFALVHAEWLEGSAQPFIAEVRAFVDALSARAAPAARAMEIERKYLLSSVPDAAREAPCVEIEQGYVPGERLVERVRRVRADGTERCYRTVKLGAGVARIEIEEETTSRIFDALWALTEGRRVRKERYAVADGDLVWEIDRFLDRDLVLAEVELSSAAHVPELPEWLREHVVRDVTGEAEYTNLSLAH